MSENDTDYRPSPTGWVRRQVEAIEAAGDTGVVNVMDRPVVMLTMRGVKTGAVRKVPLMRVEHDGVYAAVASKGGAAEHPLWYGNLRADPRITLQDGTRSWRAVAREISGEERAAWWERCVAAYPPYADYQEKTDRLIPVLLLEPTDA
ncbi:nitroreductase family deazaflavin-dependent oxidoreductase [Oryzobacter sp. R7]|uniref:nitroreductase family deazaflavin-dependent oxidoreductase n=1 Tax=Oryzobacter faecalis TaxID=3388656 RepID=UPI00398CBF88